MSELITSRQNVRVKEAVKLRAARQRAKQNRFLIDGAREISRAIDSGIEVVEAFHCPALCTTDEARRAAAQLTPAQVSDVTADVFEKLSFGQRADGLVVVAKTPRRSLDQLKLPPRPLIAVLEGLEKPGNVGAILRTADGAGVDAVIIADAGTDLFNPNTIRASLGTVFADNVCSATAGAILAKLREWQLTIVTARPDATRLYTEIDYQAGTAIVLGSEAQGLSEVWQGGQISGVRLPMAGIADSLNVSATAAAMFYEARRQRG